MGFVVCLKAVKFEIKDLDKTLGSDPIHAVLDKVIAPDAFLRKFSACDVSHGPCWVSHSSPGALYLFNKLSSLFCYVNVL